MSGSFQTRNPRGGPAIIVVAPLLIAIVAAAAVLLARGALREPPPTATAILVPTPALSPALIIGTAIFASALVISLAVILCCCRRGCAEGNVAELLRVVLAPLYASLRIIASSIAAIAETITTLAATLAGIVATLAEIAEAVRRMNVEPRPPDAPGGEPVPGSSEVASWIDGAGATLKHGADTLAANGRQLGSAATELLNAATPSDRRPF